MDEEELYTTGDRLKCILEELYFVTKGRSYTIKGVHKNGNLIITSDLSFDIILPTKHFDVDGYIRNKKINKILE